LLDELLAEPVRHDLDEQDDHKRADDDRAGDAVGEDLGGLLQDEADAAARPRGRGPSKSGRGGAA